MKVIIHTSDTGGVAICYPSNQEDIEAIKAKDTPADSIIVDSASLPHADDDFFNAWELNGVNITVNLNKAKDITKTRLRFERVPLFATQDILFQRAQETGADISAIVAEKQRLRDITKLADSCTSLEELRALKA